MCDFMQKRHNGCSGGACGPEGELVIKGERCFRFLEVRINEFLKYDCTDHVQAEFLKWGYKMNAILLINAINTALLQACVDGLLDGRGRWYSPAICLPNNSTQPWPALGPLVFLHTPDC